MSFLRTVGSRLVTAGLVLAVIAGAVSWWQMSPEQRSAAISTVGRAMLWIAVVAVTPWAMAPVVGAVGRRRSNAAGALLVGALTLAHALLLLWLMDFSPGAVLGGALGWTLAVAGVLVALAYNLLACDWIAEQLE